MLPVVEYNKAVKKQRLVWIDPVHRYTARSLTRQTDVLPGISGIAHAIAKRTDDTYHAGLWESYLYYCLLWASDWHIDRGLATHCRPETYLAPSWSWASIKGPTGYLWWMLSDHTYNPDPDPAFTPKGFHVSLRPAGEDPFGALRGAELRIRGLVKAAFTLGEKCQKGGSLQDRENLYTVVDGKLRKVGELRYDVPLCSECCPPGTRSAVVLLCCVNGKVLQDGTFKTFAIVLDADDVEASKQIRSGFAGPESRGGSALNFGVA